MKAALILLILLGQINLIKTKIAPREGHSIVLSDDKIYLFGGLTPVSILYIVFNMNVYRKQANFMTTCFIMILKRMTGWK